MRTRAIIGSIVASASVLIVGYQAGTAVTLANGSSLTLPVGNATTAPPLGGAAGTTTQAGTAPSSSTPRSAAAPAAPAPAAAAKPAVASGPRDGTYVGSSINTRYGFVQVQVTIATGSITDVSALHLTDDESRSVQISNRAAPVLRSEVIASQSSRVSNVSGATYTTQAYLASVQSALDQSAT